MGGFGIDISHMTNVQLSQFVNETDYISTAEKKPDLENIKVQLLPDTLTVADAMHREIPMMRLLRRTHPSE